jgi:hypothetical protein
MVDIYLMLENFPQRMVLVHFSTLKTNSDSAAMDYDILPLNCTNKIR